MTADAPGKRVLIRIDGRLLSYAEAAQELGVSVACVRMRAYRASWERVVLKRCSVKVRSTEYGLEKHCVVCRQWLPLDECFHLTRQGAFGRANRCKACLADYKLRRQAA